MKFGAGPRIAICFHGYGEDCTHYSFLERAGVAAEFTFYSIDLPFHGKTEWPETKDLRVSDLAAIINGIIDHSKQLIIIGFSLGGRVALSLYEQMPHRVDRLVLLAPDGLKLNFWYWLATQTFLGKHVFSFTMRHPSWFFVLLNALNGLRLVNSSIFKFVRYYVDDAEAREILYNRWMVLRKLRPNINKVKKKINKHSTTVRLLYGMHDRIILPVRANKFKRGIEQHCSISLIHSGHQVLHERHVSEILPALLH